MISQAEYEEFQNWLDSCLQEDTAYSYSETEFIACMQLNRRESQWYK